MRLGVPRVAARQLLLHLLVKCYPASNILYLKSFPGILDDMAKRMINQAHAALQLVSLSATSSSVEWVPNTDIYENEESFVIRMEVAGVDADNIHIHLSDRFLVVRGHRQDSCRAEQCHFRQMEINYGIFERRLMIPRNVEGRKIKASCRNGFLKIELPKAVKSKPPPQPQKVMIEEED